MFFLTACQNQGGFGSADDSLDEGYKYIDQGDYDQAISKLEILAQKDPRPAVKVALASAYAARGGIRVENYWGFAIGFENPLVTEPPISTSARLVGVRGLNAREVQALGGIIHTMAVWERYKERVDAIPVVEGKALWDLKAAVRVLRAVETPGGRLYRAILNLILFKSYLSASQGLWDEFNKIIADLVSGNIEVLCRFEFENILEWLEPITLHLSEAIEDLMWAYPQDRAELEDARELVQAVYQLTVDSVAELRKKRTCGS